MTARLLLLATLAATPAAAQNGPHRPEGAARDSVLAPLALFFDGMRAGDSAMARRAFHPTARLMRVSETPAGPRVTETPIGDLLEAIGRPHDEVYDERLWDVEVRRDGPLATAWTPYAFYVGEALSHCGVNAFQLARTDAGWQVIQVTDTSRREACAVPQAVQEGARW